MAGAEILERRKKVLGPSLFHYYQHPVTAPPSDLIASSLDELLCCCVERIVPETTGVFGEQVLTTN
jgi:hypothetical protein